MFRIGLAGGVESGESSTPEEAGKPTPEQTVQRFEHHQLVTGEDGKPVELGRAGLLVTGNHVFYYRFVTVRIDNDWFTALRLGENCVRQAFFHDQPESEPMPNLGQQVRDNDRLACAGHSKQDAVLRSVSEPAPDPDQVPSRPVVNGFSPFEVPGERRGPRDQVGQVGVFGWEIEGSIGAKGPSGPR